MRVAVVSLTDVDYGLDLASSLSEAGASVVLYLSRPHLARAVNSMNGTIDVVYRLGLLPSSVELRLFEWPRRRDPRSIRGATILAKEIANAGVDVAHILMGSGELWIAVVALLLRRSMGIPVASTMIVPLPNVGEYPPSYVSIAVSKLLTYGSDLVIVNGPDQVDLIRRKYGASAERVAYVPLGPRVTSARWADKPVSEEPGTILFFGRIARHKGLEYLVKAQPLISQRVPHARIVIAGNGKEEMDRCRAMILDPSCFEIHDGFVSNPLLAELFQRASLVTLPYLSASTSGILVTAYVFGKPVVATRVGCLPDYVQEGVTGLIVSPEQVEELANAVVRLLLDAPLRDQMGVSARKWAEEEQKKVAWQSLAADEAAIRLHSLTRGGRT